MDLLLPSVRTKIVGKELLLYKQTVEELCKMSKGIRARASSVTLYSAQVKSQYKFKEKNKYLSF